MGSLKLPSIRGGGGSGGSFPIKLFYSNLLHHPKVTQFNAVSLAVLLYLYGQSYSTYDSIL